MHYLTLISGLVVYRLSLIANKQEFVKKRYFVVSISEIGQKVDGKAEIEEKIDGNSEMLSPLRPPSIGLKFYICHCHESVKLIKQDCACDIHNEAYIINNYCVFDLLSPFLKRCLKDRTEILHGFLSR